VTPPVPEPTHEEIQELLGVYALDAVDPETAVMVEQHLDTCIRCTTEVAQHHEVAGLLANSGGASPPELWDGIASALDGSTPPSWDRLSERLETGPDRSSVMGGIGSDDGLDVADGLDVVDDGQVAPGAEVVPISAASRRRPWAMRAVAVVAAAAAVVAVVLGVQVNHLHHQVNASAPLSSAERSAMALASTRTVALTAGAAGASSERATVVLTRAGTGFVEAGRLAPLTDRQTYQLWGVVGQHTISLGLLGPHPSIVAFSVAGSVPVSAFAITAEHSGGVIETTHQPVVAGEVPV
jgi:Anti-sigma-K factor rskA/Putative zinc-finger